MKASTWTLLLMALASLATGRNKITAHPASSKSPLTCGIDARCTRTDPVTEECAVCAWAGKETEYLDSLWAKTVLYDIYNHCGINSCDPTPYIIITWIFHVDNASPRCTVRGQVAGSYDGWEDRQELITSIMEVAGDGWMNYGGWYIWNRMAAWDADGGWISINLTTTCR